MFDFFFKKRAVPKSPELIQSHIQEDRAIIANEIKLENRQAEKQAELIQVATFADQEDAALDFLLRANFPEARLKAAMHIHSPKLLARVAEAMRNKDRRVHKLVHEKLAQIQAQTKINTKLENCLSQGQQLLEKVPLLANQVTEWEKHRLELGAHGSSLLPIKATLEKRLQQQLELQRQVMQVSQALRSLVSQPLSLEQSQAELSACILQWQNVQSNSLLNSLPKNISDQLSLDLMTAQSQVEKLEQMNQLQSVITNTFTETSSNNEELIVQEQKPIDEPHPLKIIDVKEVLTALEQALEEGNLQQALDLDKSLKNAVVPTQGKVAQHIRAARSELKRLLDWAKWGGTVSREELTRLASGLATFEVTNQSSASELAKQVGGLRARWKELDRTSGSNTSTTQTMWEQFNAACNLAYQNAETFFKLQAQLRSDNLSIAHAQLQAIDEEIADIKNRLPDWKSHQAYIEKSKQAWRQIGVIDRKIKKHLDAEFAQKISALLQPLTEVRASALEQRLRLIQSVESISASDKDAPEKIRQIQHRWQQDASSLQLERRDEQNLWRQFRVACDAVFEQRKTNALERDRRHHETILAMQACCEELEHALEKATSYLAYKTSKEIANVLQKGKEKWRGFSQHLSKQNRLGELEARFSAAVKLIEKRRAETLVEDKKTELVHLRSKIKLCAEVETTDRSLLSDVAEQSAVWQKKWQLLELHFLSIELNKLLAQRFNHALTLFASQQQRDANDLMNRGINGEKIEEYLLRIEALRGLCSPPEFAQQRLQLQVQDLKSVLKNRDAGANYLSSFHALCVLPACFNEQQERRFQLILENHINECC